MNVTASGVLIGYQGNISDSVVRNIKFSKVPTDPVDNTLYTYAISADKTKYQLLTFLEDKNALAVAHPPR